MFEEDTYRFSNIFTPADVSEIDEYLIGDLDDIEIPDTFSYFGVKTGATIVGQNDWNAYPAGNANSTLEEDAVDAEHATYLNISKTENSTYYLYKPFSSSVSDGIIVFDADIYYGSGNIQFYYSNNGRNRNTADQYVDLFKINNSKLTANEGKMSFDVTTNTWVHITASLDYNNGSITIKLGDNAEQSFTVDKLSTEIISKYMPTSLSNFALYTGAAGELRLANLAVKKLVPSETAYKIVTANVNDENGGTVTVNGEDGTTQVERGAQTVFKAEPADGYKFINWTDDEDNEISTSATYTLAKTYVNATLTANFESEYGEGYSVKRINEFTEDFEGETNIFGVTAQSTLTSIPFNSSILPTGSDIFGNVLVLGHGAVDFNKTLTEAVTLNERQRLEFSLDTFNNYWSNSNQKQKEYSVSISDANGTAIAGYTYYDATGKVTSVTAGGTVYSVANDNGFTEFNFYKANYIDSYKFDTKSNAGTVEFTIPGDGNVKVSFSNSSLSEKQTYSGKIDGDVTIKTLKIEKGEENNYTNNRTGGIDNLKAFVVTSPEMHSLTFNATDISTSNPVTPTITVKDKDGNTVTDTDELYGTYTYKAELDGYHTVEGTVKVKDEDKTVELEMVPTTLSVVYLKDEEGNTLETKMGTNNVVYYPVIVEKDGIYYKTEANTEKQNGNTTYNFGKYFATPGTVDITYTELPNVVYYAEGETAITDENSLLDATINTHSMGGAKLAIQTTSNITIPALPVGTYSVTAGARANNTGNEHVYLKPDGSSNTDRADLVYYGSNGYQTKTGTMKVVTADKPVAVSYSSGSRVYLDYIYIIKMPDEYTVTFDTDGGGDVESQTVEEGKTATKPSDPTKDGYTFKGWQLNGANYDFDTAVTGDITLKAVWEINKYTVTWKDDSTTLETDENIEYNTAPSYDSAVPEKTPSDTTVYTFSGWKVANSNGEATGDLITTEQLANQKIIADTTYLAQFTETTRKYKITFVDEDGSTVLKAETEYEYGAAVDTPNNPEKTATEEYTYSFAGWSPAVTTVSGNQVYKATYTSTPVDYTVTKANTTHGEIELSKETAHKGEEITVTLTPETGYRLVSLTVKDEDKTSSVSNNQYTFTMPADNVTVAATFEEIPADAYTITIDSNITDGTVTTTPNGSATKGQVVTITATPDNGYQLKADSIKVNNGAVTVINNTFTMPEGNVTITAEFELKTYTITWMLDENTKIDETTVDYNVLPTHADASKAATDEYTYTFKGWTPTIVAATENATYTAQFESVKRKYTITWNIDGAETTEELDYGATPSYSGTPTKAEDEAGKYSFASWSPTVEAVTKAQTYTAQFDLIAKYTITYNTDGGQINDDNYPQKYYAGEGVALPSDVTKDNYYFTGWYDNAEFNGEPVTSITASDNGNKEYWAQWTQGTPTEYLITFVNWDNTELQKSNIAVGATPEYTGTTPTKAEDGRYTYEFIGWTPEIVTVSGIATYKAEFKQYIKTLSNIATIEKVKDNGGINLIITPTQSELQTINLYVAIYNADGSLKSVGMTRCAKDGNNIIVPLTEPQIENGESYKLMLWDISQSPLITAITNSDSFFN